MSIRSLLSLSLLLAATAGFAQDPAQSELKLELLPNKAWWGMITKGTTRTVQILPGQWKADDGTLTTGPIQQTFTVPLDRLLYFE